MLTLFVRASLVSYRKDNIQSFIPSLNHLLMVVVYAANCTSSSHSSAHRHHSGGR